MREQASVCLPRRGGIQTYSRQTTIDAGFVAPSESG